MNFRDGYPSTAKSKPFFKQACDAYGLISSHKCPGSEFLGWMDLPKTYPKNKEFTKILEAAEEIKSTSEVLLVIGIGGSYMGARAGIEFVGARSKTEIIFAGNNMSDDQLIYQMKYLEKKDFSINVISKSGTTTEPAIAFRFFKHLLEVKYGKAEAAKRIYATTDKEKGALKKLADKTGYTTFVIPDDVGGRFSVLTAVGLLPMAVAGLDITKIMEGAATVSRNDVISYSAWRHYCHETCNRPIEILANFDPSLHYLGEWWKQLFAESEGKNGRGIWPCSADYTTDLHSIGQFVQEGPAIFLETFICIDKLTNTNCCMVSHDKENLDNLNYLEGKSLDYINYTALTATIGAHSVGDKVLCSEIHICDKNEYEFGQLVYFFESACAISANMFGVNAFNQPGVEAYKTNMFQLLGKPGYKNKT